MKKILLLGSSGSIGQSTCNCIRRHPEEFTLVGASVNKNITALQSQIEEFSPQAVCVSSSQEAEIMMPQFSGKGTFFTSLIKLVEETDFDILVNALVGAVGFAPTVAALKKNKRVALANKESLVIGGDLITSLIADGYGELIPVDSEHSALLQCITGEERSSLESITVTASGGPFRQTPIEQFSSITKAQALNHPTWAMGNKITIDSSTLINKGFEIIEAHHLFNASYDILKVLIHPQSIIHSYVTFHDGAVIAQCGLPDMELPIQYALSYPKRLPIAGNRLDLAALGSLTFEAPDLKRFPCLKLCIDAGKAGGTLPTVLNASNEIAVQLFLEEKIGYTEIPTLIAKQLDNHENQTVESVEQIQEIDHTIRQQLLDSIR